MSFVIMLLAIILGCFSAQKLYDKGFRAGWLAVVIISLTSWFLAFAYILSQWGIR
jgi:hypothetical protein